MFLIFLCSFFLVILSKKWKHSLWGKDKYFQYFGNSELQSYTAEFSENYTLLQCSHKQRPGQKPKWPKHESIGALTEGASVSQTQVHTYALALQLKGA